MGQLLSTDPSAGQLLSLNPEAGAKARIAPPGRFNPQPITDNPDEPTPVPGLLSRLAGVFAGNEQVQRWAQPQTANDFLSLFIPTVVGMTSAATAPVIAGGVRAVGTGLESLGSSRLATGALGYGVLGASHDPLTRAAGAAAAMAAAPALRRTGQTLQTFGTARWPFTARAIEAFPGSVTRWGHVEGNLPALAEPALAETRALQNISSAQTASNTVPRGMSAAAPARMPVTATGSRVSGPPGALTEVARPAVVPSGMTGTATYPVPSPAAAIAPTAAARVTNVAPTEAPESVAALFRRLSQKPALSPEEYQIWLRLRDKVIDEMATNVGKSYAAGGKK